MIHILNVRGVTITDESDQWYQWLIKINNLGSSYEDIIEGKDIVMTNDQIAFWKTHKEYDPYHLYYMLELTLEEIAEKNKLVNEQIQETRERKYISNADPLYMGYVKNLALGNEEKAKKYYDDWLLAIQQVKDENPYITE